MTNGAPSWIYPVYNVVALAGVSLLIYVMQKTEHDRINKVDAPRVQWMRRLAFTGTGLALCYSVVDYDWPRHLPILLLVGSGVAILAVNAMALHMRTPPDNGRRSNVRSSFVFRRIGATAYEFFNRRIH